MIEHTLLDAASLSAEAQRALGPGPAKIMAARGMAPLADPVDLVSVLYQLTLDADEKIKGPAQGSLKGLPEKILIGALSSSKIDLRVIDYCARQIKDNDKVTEAVILNQSTGDETIAWLGHKANKHQVDLIAQNEQRILRHPEIIAALYTNRQARMSTVDRVVELAVRNDVKVAGIPAWEEVCRALHQAEAEGEVKPDAAQMDALFEKVAGANDSDTEAEEQGEQEEKVLTIREMTVPMKIRLAMMGNAFDRGTLVRDPKKIVAMAAIKSPGVKETEAAKYASNNSICEEVIGYIAMKREWTKGYNVKLSLVQNPKCPLPAAMRMMPHLRQKDIRTMARSKNIPSALSAQARKLSMARGGGGGK